MAKPASLETRLKQLEDEVSKLNTDVTSAEHALRRAEAALADKRTKQLARIDGLRGEMATLQQQIREQQADIDLREFHETARLLDADGENPALLNRFLHLTKALRSYRRIGQSHEATSMLIARLRSEPGTRPLAPQMNTWSAIARAWCKPAEVVA
jgi:septal ring factor EnvC (AmiA/AmiB activator)